MMQSIILLQIPVLHTQLKMIPIYFSLLGAGMQLISAFKVILLQGGVGKNGSTVAVSRSMSDTFYNLP